MVLKNWLWKPEVLQSLLWSWIADPPDLQSNSNQFWSGFIDLWSILTDLRLCADRPWSSIRFWSILIRFDWSSIQFHWYLIRHARIDLMMAFQRRIFFSKFFDLFLVFTDSSLEPPNWKNMMNHELYLKSWKGLRVK